MSNTVVHAMSVEQIDILKTSAVNFGFDGDMIVSVLEKFGPDVFSLMVEAARSGFSIQWIVDTFNKFGPNVLQFLTDLMNKNLNMAGMSEKSIDGEVHTGILIDNQMVQGLNTNLIEQLLEKLLPQLLEKLLPVLLEKYGPQLIQGLIDAILNTMKPKLVVPVGPVHNGFVV